MNTNYGKDDRVIYKLRSLAVYGSQFLGICGHIAITIDEGTYRYIRHLMTVHPDYSGDPMYPISTTQTLNPVDQYNRAYDQMWDKTTHYGRARRRLCVFIARKLVLVWNVQQAIKLSRGTTRLEPPGYRNA